MFVGKAMGLTRVGSSLTHKHLTGLERLAKDKHSSLLQKSVNYDCKSFIVQAPVVLKKQKVFDSKNDFFKFQIFHFFTFAAGATTFSIMTLYIMTLSEIAFSITIRK
jgi:hypothetical protein